MSSAIPSIAPERIPAAGYYRLDPLRTEVRFTTRHLFGLGKVTGTVTVRDAEFSIGEPTSETTVAAVLDAASFDTGSVKRDSEVHSAKYLDTAAFPDIVFTCTLVEQSEGNWVALGVVTAHGVTAPVDVIVYQFNTTLGGELALHATAKIDRYAHGVTAGKGLAGRWLDIDITAVATR
jgi:polyisoprenoid-binding protein YceI